MKLSENNGDNQAFGVWIVCLFVCCQFFFESECARVCSFLEMNECVCLSCVFRLFANLARIVVAVRKSDPFDLPILN